MTINPVAGTTGQNNGNFTTSAIDTTGADLIILSLTCSHGSSAAFVASISDSKGNTWTNTGGVFQVDGSNNADSTIVYCINPTVGTGHTFSTTGAGAILQSMCVEAYSGANGGFDSVHSGGNSSGSFTVQPGSVTPNQNNSLIIVCGTAVQVAPTITINQGFTKRQEQPLVAGQTYGSWIMELIQGTAAAVNPTITSTSNANGMGALTFVFKGAATASTETGTAVLGFAGISFNATGQDRHTGAGNLAFSGIAFNAVGGRQETGAANLAFQGISFNGAGSITHIKGTGVMAFGGISIVGNGFNVGQPGGLRQFWTC